MTEFKTFQNDKHHFGPKKGQKHHYKIPKMDIDLSQKHGIDKIPSSKKGYRRGEGIKHMGKSHISKRILQNHKNNPSEPDLDEILSQIEEFQGMNENQLNQLITNIPINYKDGLHESIDQIEFENLSKIQKQKYLEGLNQQQLAAEITKLRLKEKQAEGISLSLRYLQ